jgi:hypothetical protein
MLPETVQTDMHGKPIGSRGKNQESFKLLSTTEESRVYWRLLFVSLERFIISSKRVLILPVYSLVDNLFQ